MAKVAKQHDVILANCLLAMLSDKYMYKESKTFRVQFAKDLAATELTCLYMAMLTITLRVKPTRASLNSFSCMKHCEVHFTDLTDKLLEVTEPQFLTKSEC